LKKVGRISHITRSGLFVIELEEKISPLTYLLDSSKRKIAIAVDLIGPITKPFCIAKPLVRKPESLIGSEVYVKLERRRRKI